jgi:hypothetical protein
MTQLRQKIAGLWANLPLSAQNAARFPTRVIPFRNTDMYTQHTNFLLAVFLPRAA